MDNMPKKITFINKKTQRRHITHVVTKKKKKSSKFAIANCKKWGLVIGLPLTFKVFYGKQMTTWGKFEKIDNEMECKTIEDFNWAVLVFVKEYF